MNYGNFSVHIPDLRVLRRIKAAAKATGRPPGAFIREAAIAAMERWERNTLAGQAAVEEREAKSKTKKSKPRAATAKSATTSASAPTAATRAA